MRSKRFSYSTESATSEANGEKTIQAVTLNGNCATQWKTTFACWLCFLFLLICGAAKAQTITGNITGTVTDPSGAVIPKATATATNVATGVRIQTTTNADGIYSIRFLQIGRYTVTIEASGFETETQGPFMLEVDQTAQVNAALKMGSVTTRVFVNSAPPILNTQNPTIATTFDSTTLSSIPIAGDNLSWATLYVPGATTPNISQMTSFQRNTSYEGIASFNGNRQQDNNFEFDGVDINETINNLIGYNPAPEALSEMKVITANAGAEYGNVGGGEVMEQLKSGTNQFHGELYAYVQNYLMDANSWGNDNARPIISKAHYTYPRFGATLGGPILKNKLFFFADYRGDREHLGGKTSGSVPTALMRQGNFSELLNPHVMCNDPTQGGVCRSNSSLIQLYDPDNNLKPYANNENIPVTNPVATFLFAHPSVFPLPNATPAEDSPVSGNYQAYYESLTSNNQGDVKIDYTPTQKDRLSIGWSQGEDDSFSSTLYNSLFPAGNEFPDKLLAVNYVRTFSASTVNEFRAGYSRIRWNQGDPTDPSGLFGLNGDHLVGIPASSQFPQQFPGFADMIIGGFSGAGTLAGGTNFIDNTFVYSDNFTTQRGKHLINIGVQFTRYQQNNFYPGNNGAMGQFNFNGVYTSCPGCTAGTASNPNGYNTSGYSMADFLLDRVDYVGIGGVVGRTGSRQWRDAYFAQDDWRIRPDLTLNLGVRYEYDQPIYEVNNKEANINMTTGAVEYAGVDGNSRALYNPYYGMVEPRFGFAYKINPRVVVRGGFGQTAFLESTGLTGQPPFQPNFSESGTPPTPTNPGVYFQVTNGFSAANPNYGSSWGQLVPNLRPALTSQFNLTTEYALTRTSSLSVGYVGEVGQHLLQAVAANQLHTPCDLPGGPSGSACAAVDPAPYQALVGQGGFILRTASEAMMNYNALQATVRQRPTAGLDFTVNYTYGKALTNSVGFYGAAYAQNAYDNHAEYGPSPNDIRQSLNGTAVYHLPFGRGERFGSNINRLTNEAAGGWKLAATAIVYSGFPETPWSPSNVANTNSRGSARANQLRPLRIVHRSLEHWYGTDPSTVACTGPDNGVCAFQIEQPNTYGTAHIGSLPPGPGYQEYDLAAFKNFHVWREQSLGFRVDAFNAFNIQSYGGPDTTVTSGTFGKSNFGVRNFPRSLQLSAHYTF